MRLPRWTVFEVALEAASRHEDPLREASARLLLTAPSGQRRAVEAFWDGESRWRARFRPDEVGEWSWESRSSDPGLDGERGAFRCVPYEGDNPLYRHGPPRLSGDRRSFERADGTPLFWLADTAWNGGLRAPTEDWGRYLRARRDQGFTVVQLVATHWRGCSKDRLGEKAFESTEPLAVNPAFFRRLDEKVSAVNAYGMVAAPVMLWAFEERDVGRKLSEESAVLLARHMVARWGAHHVAWLLGGDGDYRGVKAERWRRIGRAVFDEPGGAPATMHPRGLHWVGGEFRDEPWYDFVGYQSGHGSSDEHLRWLVEGPPASDRQERPVINLEPNYEAHPSSHEEVLFSDREVRRAAYWSLLVSPTAGVTYGHSSTWVWAGESEVPEGHDNVYEPVPPWWEGLWPPGARSMGTMRRFFETLPWWRLRPAPGLLAEQPESEDPRRFVAAAKTEDGTLALFYLPEGGEIRPRFDGLRLPAPARWFDPATGDWTEAGTLNETPRRLEAPGEGDHLLCVGELEEGDV